ncbi:hypothetical protein GCM10007160_39070 [Litchfieldella qijiaojingensis]|uniref:Transposase IS4-like domain-containing protein n=1 Tax=Litchfieldella qijiaojingensis TaxID=980347 RepID=A0ABQ2Z9E9_9GAMM|nr:hypothetical protein GCM10007160_39070 [Halomonas qijiaojingensis]
MQTLLLAIEKAKASIRAKVEHPFHVIKDLFGHRMVRYKGLPKNQTQPLVVLPGRQRSHVLEVLVKRGEAHAGFRRQSLHGHAQAVLGSENCNGGGEAACPTAWSTATPSRGRAWACASSAK